VNCHNAILTVHSAALPCRCYFRVITIIAQRPAPQPSYRLPANSTSSRPSRCSCRKWDRVQSAARLVCQFLFGCACCIALPLLRAVSTSVPSFNAHRWRCARLIARLAARTPIAYVCTLPPCSGCYTTQCYHAIWHCNDRKGESILAYTQLIGMQCQRDSHNTPAKCCPH
jgi:hypothetical protein